MQTQATSHRTPLADPSWRAQVLYRSALALLVCAFLYALFFAVAAGLFSVPVLVIALGGVAAVPVIVLSRRGLWLDLLGNYTVAVLWLVLVVLGCLTGGPLSPAKYWMPALPVIALLFVGWRSALGWALVGFLHEAALHGWVDVGHTFPQILPGPWLHRYELVAQGSLAVLLVALGWVYLRARDAAVEAEWRGAQRLIRSEQRFRALVERLPLAVLVHRHGEVIYANTEAVSLSGYGSLEALVGMPILDLTDPADRAAVSARVAQLVEVGDSATPSELRLLRKDGTGVPLEVSSFTAEFGGEPSVVVIGVDLSDRKRFTARMMEVDRMMAAGTLAAGVAHEINNPLTFVNINLQLARDTLMAAGDVSVSKAQRDELAVLLADATEGSERIRDIVKDLMTFSSINEEEAGPMDVVSLLDGAIRMVQNQIDHRAELVREYGEVPRALGNGARLSQVLVNLLVNASQAIAEGAAHENRIVARIRSEGGRVIVEVQDTGTGISKQILARIFDPFFTTKPPGEGTGLGLAICRRLVADMGGTLEVESELGVGSTFRVSLPEALGAQPSAEPEVAETAPTPTRILVVDDEPLVRRTLARLLGRNHDVELVADGATALARLESGDEYDVILCDLMMPDMTAMDLHEILRDRGDLVSRMIFMTGGAFTARARAFVESIDRPVIDKPPEKGVLEAAIAEVVAQRARR